MKVNTWSRVTSTAGDMLVNLLLPNHQPPSHLPLTLTSHSLSPPTPSHSCLSSLSPPSLPLRLLPSLSHSLFLSRYSSLCLPTSLLSPSVLREAVTSCIMFMIWSCGVLIQATQNYELNNVVPRLPGSLCDWPVPRWRDIKAEWTLATAVPYVFILLPRLHFHRLVSIQHDTYCPYASVYTGIHMWVGWGLLVAYHHSRWRCTAFHWEGLFPF